jgi:hypothetical protein
MILAGLLVASAALAPQGAAEPAESQAVIEDRLRTAVFHQQYSELVTADPDNKATVLCLSLDPGGAPQSLTEEALRALRLGPAVRRGALCEVRAPRAVEIATGRTAIVVTVGPIEWRGHDEAWVTVTQTWSSSRSLRRPYRVVREPDGAWTSLGPILVGNPAS